MKILVTGATGFVGSALLLRLSLDPQHQVKAALRRDISNIPGGVTPVQVGGLCPETDWQPAVSGVNTIVHTAARAHVMNDTAGDPLAEYRRVNVVAVLNLARQAAAAGAGRFIFISSIKVNGEGTPLGRPYSADDAPAPIDPYGISKREAEDGLRQLAAETGMEVVIIRPPLVYGPGVKANFLSMMRWLSKGMPLPLGAIHNRRSLVALGNLVDLIVTCIEHPAAANETFLVSDGEDLSTTELLRRMGQMLGRPARLLPVSPWMLEAGAALLCKRTVLRRLCGSLQVDITKTRSRLSWSPPVSVDDALRATARHFLESSFR
ncbi:MAG: SDR family oxidoreductase [Sulfuricaulis sp.]|uniref:UDP-glucose 4-epimerase family protein n=1 Tax=Sulfuricaulis sp. TaxID=2003553 RepID=UPI0025DED7C9|nr:SDR family oxidoreductase [Sulfuricaulis sp.]MCR4347999.1 SDR family oxidoreductase [Sulfuricaulis sp.]